jgi:hypothetical protein
MANRLNGRVLILAEKTVELAEMNTVPRVLFSQSSGLHPVMVEVGMQLRKWMPGDGGSASGPG